MGRKKKFKEEKENIIEEQVLTEQVVQEPVVLISLNEFLSKYNGQRVLDKVIRKWYLKKDPYNTKRSINDWSNLIQEFHNEIDK